MMRSILAGTIFCALFTALPHAQFIDDFEDGTLDTGLYTILEGPSGTATVTETGGELVFEGVPDPPDTWDVMTVGSVDSFPRAVGAEPTQITVDVRLTGDPFYLFGVYDASAPFAGWNGGGLAYGWNGTALFGGTVFHLQNQDFGGNSGVGGANSYTLRLTFGLTDGALFEVDFQDGNGFITGRDTRDQGTGSAAASYRLVMIYNNGTEGGPNAGAGVVAYDNLSVRVDGNVPVELTQFELD